MPLFEVGIARDAADWVVDVLTIVGTWGAAASALWLGVRADRRAAAAEVRAEAAEERERLRAREADEERRQSQARAMRLTLTSLGSADPTGHVMVAALIENRSDDIAYDFEVHLDGPARVSEPEQARVDRLTGGGRERRDFQVYLGTAPDAPPVRLSGSLVFADAAGRQWRRTTGGHVFPWPGPPRVSLEKTPPTT